jgi:predicted PurR-regulated permease PerM
MRFVRRCTAHRRFPGYVGHRPYDIDVTLLGDGPSGDDASARSGDARGDAVAERVDLDAHSAVPIAIAFAVLAVAVWLVRSIPRTLALTAIASLIAIALMPLVEALRRRTGWDRRYAAALVLVVTGALVITTIVLVTVPTINQISTFNKEIPKTVDQLGQLPIIGPRLRHADASNKVRQWLNDVPKRLDVNSTPIANTAGTVADGVFATLSALLLAITVVLDGERLVRMGRRLVPPRQRPHADRLGLLVYNLVGRYLAGTLLVAVLAGVVTLITSLALGVPLAPLLAVWMMICNPMPQIGGFLGAVPFVAFGLSESAVVGVICLVVFLIYQQLENHVLQPLIIGRAVSLTPPSTMVAALVGVAAGGVVGGVLAIPLLGASKAIYLALRTPELEVPEAGWAPPTEHLPSSDPGSSG